MTTTDLIELRKMDDYGTVTSIGGMGGLLQVQLGIMVVRNPPFIVMI